MIGTVKLLVSINYFECIYSLDSVCSKSSWHNSVVEPVTFSCWFCYSKGKKDESKRKRNGKVHLAFVFPIFFPIFLLLPF